MSGRASIAAAKQFRQKIRRGASCAGPRQRQASKNLPIRIMVGYGEIAEIEEFLGCGGLQSSKSYLAALSEAGFEPVTVGYALGEVA